MSSPAFDAPLALDVRPSRALRAALLALHALAGAGLLVLPGPWLAGGAVVLVMSLVLEWRRSGRAYRLRWRADGSWEQPGISAAGSTVHESTFVSRWLVVLALHDGRRTRRWALVRDALPATQWRRLRARLRVEGPTTAARGLPARD